MAVIRALLTAMFTFSLSAAAYSQPYPTKPIKLVAPFPAGGPVDVMARLVAQLISVKVGQVVVENRPGVGGTLGARAVANAEPDGYTLLFASSTTLGVSPQLYKNVDYDPVRSFAPIALISKAPFVLVVNPKIPVRTVQELIAYAKANPGKLNFGFPSGTLPQLTGELFKLRTGIDIAFIPYKGAANTITDILSGQIDLAFEPAPVLLAHIHDAKVRPLAITSLTRSAQLPDVPTLDESGVSGFASISWTGVVAPAGTSVRIIDMLNAAINAELRSNELQTTLIRLGAEPKAGSPRDFAEFIAAEVPKWAEVVNLSGMKPD